MNFLKNLGCTLGFAALLLLAGCGGGAPESLFEAAGATGIDIENPQLTDDGIGVTFGDADVGFGGTRPEWLESEFVLPEGLEISLAVNDPANNDRAISGQVNGGDLAAIAAEQDAAMLAAGYEQLGDSGIYVAPGRTPVEINLSDDGTAVLFSMEHNLNEEQVLRDVHAPIEGDGVMDVRLGDDEFVLTGSCSLRSTSGDFSSDDDTAPDATSFTSGGLTIEVREGEQDYILGNLVMVTDDNFASYGVLQVDDAGNFPTVAVDASGFSFSGWMFSFDGGDNVEVTLDVTCPA